MAAILHSSIASANLFCFRGRCCSRTFADNFDHCLLIFGAIVVDLFAKVGDEAAGGHGHSALRIKLAAGSHPPRPGDNGDETVIRMEMRPAHGMRTPFDEHDVESGLIQSALQDSHLGSWQ